MARNLVLVTADSLRADHCGFINPASELTPALDEVASDGVVFEHTIAPGPRTPSSMPATFTGEFMPPVAIQEPDYWQALRRHIRRHLDRHRTLPERLQAQGYTTLGFSVNPWTENTGFEHGFDRFYTLNSDFLEGYGSPAFRLIDRALRDNRVGERVKWFNKRDWFIRWTDFYDAIVDEIRQADPPYFAWVFLLDTHQPYISPARYRRESSAPSMYYATFRELLMDDANLSSRVDRWLRQAYRDSVRSVDGFVQTLLDDLTTDDPVLVFHSDHGEAFGAHGTYGHEQALYRENVHVPLLVHDGESKARIQQAISLLRLPELVAGLQRPGELDIASIQDGLAVSTTEDGAKRSVGTTKWNLISDSDEEVLFDLQRDPDEMTDVATEYGNLLEGLRAALAVHGEAQAERHRIADAVADELSIEAEQGSL